MIDKMIDKSILIFSRVFMLIVLVNIINASTNNNDNHRELFNKNNDMYFKNGR